MRPRRLLPSTPVRVPREDLSTVSFVLLGVTGRRYGVCLRFGSRTWCFRLLPEHALQGLLRLSRSVGALCLGRQPHRLSLPLLGVETKIVFNGGPKFSSVRTAVHTSVGKDLLW